MFTVTRPSSRNTMTMVTEAATAAAAARPRENARDLSSGAKSDEEEAAASNMPQGGAIASMVTRLLPTLFDVRMWGE